MPLNEPDRRDGIDRRRLGAVADTDLPRGMTAKPEVGDLEEAMVDVMPTFSVQEKMPEPLADGQLVDTLQRDIQQTENRVERVAGRTAAESDDFQTDVPDPDVGRRLDTVTGTVGVPSFEFRFREVRD